MVVGVLETRLEHVVIDVRDGQLVADPRETERLELEVRERAGRILGQRVIDPDRDLLPRRKLARVQIDQVLAQDPFGDGAHH